MKASEMQAARKAAKKEQAVKKYARNNIGNQRADRNKLDFIQTAMQKILIPFEQNTGISLINYNQFRKDLVQAEII